MERIGFGEQPYLVYQHRDAGHPHIHILASTIRADGTRINTHNIGRNQSEIARRFLEEKYNLVKAENQRMNAPKQVIPFDLKRVEYGRSEIRQGIANVLKGVLGTYNYTSLPHLNAILKQYNILADRGLEDGFMYAKKGLLYRVLDTNGHKIGVPIKASQLPGSPTLSNLEKRFEKNEKLREPLRQSLRQLIDKAMDDRPSSIADLARMLANLQVTVVPRQNPEGKM